MVTAYGTSRAAPISERFLTAQLYALRLNSMIALFKTRRRLVLWFSSFALSVLGNMRAFRSGPVSKAGWFNKSLGDRRESRSADARFAVISVAINHTKEAKAQTQRDIDADSLIPSSLL
jgi:hypothetical protein